MVLDHRLGLAPEEEEEQEVTDRAYWEKRSSKTIVDMADEVLRLVKTLDQDLDLKYNRFYVSLCKNNKPFNFVIFRPKKTSLGIEPKLKKAEEIEIMLDSAGLDLLEYDTRNQRYRIRFSNGEIQRHERLLKEILGRAYRESNGDISWFRLALKNNCVTDCTSVRFGGQDRLADAPLEKSKPIN